MNVKPQLMKLIFPLIYLSLMCSPVLNTFGSDDRLNSAVDQVFALLASTPSWPMLGVEDDAKRKQIDEAYTKVAQYDDATIRLAMKRYIRCSQESEKCESTHAFSVFNLVVLNRFVFNVPEHVSKEKIGELPFYLGMGAPQDDKGVNLLWPLAVAKNGAVALKAQFYAHDGPLPDPLGEFDVFKKAFGKRFPVQQSR